MKLNNNQQAFFELVRAGLWERKARLSHYGVIDYDEVFRIADEQCVIGLVTAGTEYVHDVIIPQEVVLQFIGTALQLEQQNLAMDDFVVQFIGILRKEDVYALLVKGQGVAQCYERPFWRAPGDVDLLLDNENYTRAQSVLYKIGENIHEENSFDKHFSAEIDEWVVELHGSLRSMLSKQTDEIIDKIQENAFKNKRCREWIHKEVIVPLPNVDDDVIFVFTHILKHFFHYGIGIRQICDWCRLLWTYRSELDLRLLESRIAEMGLMNEWKAFGAFAVDYLGMPSEAMPFYSSDKKWKRKADRICSFILETGNFGHNRETSYYEKYPGVVSSVISLWIHTCDSIRHSFIFPIDSMKIWCRMFSCGIKDAFKGK